MDERNYIPPDPIPVSRYPAGKRELTFGAAVLVCSVFLWNCILYGGFNLGFAIGCISVIVCSVWYLLNSGYRFDPYSGALVCFSVLIAAGFAWSSDGFIKFVMLLFLLFSVNLSFCLAAGQNRRSPEGIGSLLDAPRACFKLGFGSMGAAGRGLNDARKNAGTAGKKGSAAALGIVIAVPVVAVMLVLLMRADAAFEGLMALLPETDWSELFCSLLFGGFAAWVSYARGVGLRYAQKPDAKERRFQGLSPITIHIILGAAGCLYCVYLFSQLAYISGGFSGILPEGYTMAEYARRGFFEMAWLSAINLCLICCAMGLVEKKAGAPVLTKMLCLFLGIVTLFLICTASAKMLLYIGSFGLTRLRVLTQIIMVWLGITTVLVSVWLFRPKFPYMKAVILMALLLGTLTLWVDVDSQVARYNVRAYQDGRLETIDMSHLRGLGYGAVPYIEELTRDENPAVAEAAETTLKYRDCSVKDFRDWNYTRAAAGKISEAFLLENPE